MRACAGLPSECFMDVFCLGIKREQGRASTSRPVISRQQRTLWHGDPALLSLPNKHTHTCSSRRPGLAELPTARAGWCATAAAAVPLAAAAVAGSGAGRPLGRTPVLLPAPPLQQGDRQGHEQQRLHHTASWCHITHNRLLLLLLLYCCCSCLGVSCWSGLRLGLSYALGCRAAHPGSYLARAGRLAHSHTERAHHAASHPAGNRVVPADPGVLGLHPAATPAHPCIAAAPSMSAAGGRQLWMGHPACVAVPGTAPGLVRGGTGAGCLITADSPVYVAQVARLLPCGCHRGRCCNGSCASRDDGRPASTQQGLVGVRVRACI